jgi:hypothetical protein
MIKFLFLPDAESASNSNEKINEENTRPTNRTQTENEFVSDYFDHENINADEIKSDLKQLNLENKKLEGICRIIQKKFTNLL